MNSLDIHTPNIIAHTGGGVCICTQGIMLHQMNEHLIDTHVCMYVVIM